MKRFIFLVLSLSALAMITCNKMDSTYRDFIKDGQITYSARVDSLKVYSGRNRVMVTWRPISDPRVNKVKIFWSSRADSLEVPIATGKDTVAYIEDLAEGNYVFDFYTYDEEGHQSVKSEAVGRVYDTIYERGLLLRDVNNIVVSGTSVTLTFKSMTGVAGYLSQEIVYTSTLDGQQKTVDLPADESELTISDFSGQNFTHRSVYRPQLLSPDLFYSAEKNVDINSNTSNLQYTNPVFMPIMADPTVIQDPVSGFFYAYGTEDRWPTDNKNHIVPIVRSKDLVNWTYAGDAFTAKPSWKSSGGVWAPDIALVNGKYHLYYSYSTWGDADPGIGLAISSFPTGVFVDQGKMFLSSEIGVPNSIDPFYYEDGGKKYLFWGSFSSAATQGTYGVELTDDGKQVKDMAQKFKIAAGDFEAVNIFKKNGYYYFFGSKGGCCDGVSSTYNVRVARATSLTGPYLDKEGRDIALRGNGTLVLQRSDKFVGPGHNARLITDKDGHDWMLYHAMDVDRAVINDVNQRALFLDRVYWDSSGWPLVNDGRPSGTKMAQPKF